MRTYELSVAKGTKGQWGFAVGVLALGSYLLSNHYHFREPQLLPLWTIDRVVPFLPATIWLYFSSYLMVVLAYVWLQDPVRQARYLVGFLTLCVGSSLIFLIWPTTYPRVDFPVSEGAKSFSEWGLYAFRFVDTPANCAPSMHVSTAYYAAFAFLWEQRRKLGPMLVWASLIWISTLTTKQHYWVDGLLGLVFAIGVYRFVVWYVPDRRRALAPRTARARQTRVS